MRKLFVWTVVLLLPLSLAHSQMVTGERMKNYETVFGVKPGQRSDSLDIDLLESLPESNVLYPGEQPVFRFLLTNRTNTPIQGDARMDVIAYGSRTIPGDIWKPDLFKIGDLESLPMKLDIPANGSQIVELKPVLPPDFGAYALVADLGPHGRRFSTSCVRTFAASTERLQYPSLSLDDGAGIPVLRRLGIQAIRMELGFIRSEEKDAAQKMARLEERIRECTENNITVLLTIGHADKESMPLGQPRPHLSDEDAMRDTKADTAWLPKYDADFRRFVAELCTKFGWPRGPVTAVQLFNEPWEGMSISGWGADMPRYREIFTAMAEGVEDARKTGAEVLIAGCDSSSNTFDKLFGDGSDTFLKWLDACTIHYQGPAAPSIYRAWIDRKSPQGRVRIWDTESWVANTEDRIAPVIAANRALGYDRAMGTFYGNVSQANKSNVTLPDGSKREVRSFNVWPPAVGVGAVRHFIGERRFDRILFPNGLPWVLVFSGLSGDADRGTLVVTGDLNAAFEKDIMPFRTVRAQEGAALKLADPKGEFALFDLYGNAVAAKDGQLSVPLDHRGFFLQTKGGVGSFERLVKAVQSAEIAGYPPVEIQAHDLLEPVDGGAKLRITMTNVLNVPLRGALDITLAGQSIPAPEAVSLAPHETRVVEIPLPKMVPRDDNSYPLRARFDSGQNAAVLHEENLHVNQISKRPIVVDGKLDDWKGVLPHPVRAANSQGPSLMESAWLPFKKFDTTMKAGVANGYLAYDSDYLYFAAKILDDTPSPGTLRFAKRDPDADFYPVLSYEYDGKKTFLKKEETWDNPQREEGALMLPGSTSKRSHAAWTSLVQAFAFDLNLASDETRQLSLYFVDWETHLNGRRRVLVELQNPATGSVLARTVVKEFGPGIYAKFLVRGKIRCVLRTEVPWLSASLSGIFLDPANETLPDAPAARLLGEDRETAGAWSGKFGREGFAIPGIKESLPSSATLVWSQDAPRIEHRWPEGVRRFSYRRNPTLPFGSTPKIDNVQIAFNVIPRDQKAATISHPPGTMPGFIAYQDTDYEYALNSVAEAHGGGTEIWRCLVPGMVRKHFYPRQPASRLDGSVDDGQLVIQHEGNTRMVELALPWSELPEVKKALDGGRTVKFSFRVNDDQGPGMELPEGRSVSKKNMLSLHPDWVTHWANEVEFAFQK